MKTKLGVGLVLISILALSIGLMGCAGDMHGTGGGFIEDCNGDKVTFGFNFHATGDRSDFVAKGQFQLVDHSVKPPLRIHGTFDDVDRFWLPLIGTQYLAEGMCEIKGEGSFKFYLYAFDDGEPGIDDFVYVHLVIPGGGGFKGIDNDLIYHGMIDGGNLQMHEKY